MTNAILFAFPCVLWITQKLKRSVMNRNAFFAIYQKKPLWLILLFIVVAVGLNGLFSTINAALNFPFFFDSIWVWLL